MRRSFLRGTRVLAALLATPVVVATATVASTSVADAIPLSTYTVPADTCSLMIRVVGGEGGAALFSTGGSGGQVSATLPVRPGDVFTYIVGTKGEDGTNLLTAPVPGGSGGTGHAPGGAAGASFVNGGSAIFGIDGSGGGGGASAVLRSGEPILVAGGGGGGTIANVGGAGGSGATTNVGNVAAGGNGITEFGGGGGVGASTDGTGGSGGDGLGRGLDVTAGASAVAGGAGGAGGDGDYNAGGGGGGGYGGGGGGGGGEHGFGTGRGGSGAGGASWASPTAGFATFGFPNPRPSHSGDGRVTFTPIRCDLPDAPTGVTAVLGSVVVSWTPPEFTGTSEIAGYVITEHPSGATYTASGAVTSFTIPCPTLGTWTYTVQAVNGSGSSAASAPSNPVTVTQVCAGAAGAAGAPAIPRFTG